MTSRNVERDDSAGLPGPHRTKELVGNAGMKSNHEECVAIRRFYELIRDHAKQDAAKNSKATRPSPLYSVMLPFPPWVERRYLFSLAHQFAQRIATRSGASIFLVGDTRPCPEEDCQRLYERLAREKEPSLGFHFHGICDPRRDAERVRKIWVNLSGAADKPTWVRAIEGVPGEWKFANNLSRVIMYHTKRPPHLGLDLSRRVVASGVFAKLWRKATGWESADPNLDPFAGSADCGDPSKGPLVPRGDNVANSRVATGTRLCGCGCGGSIDHMAPQAHFLPGHQMRAIRQRRREGQGASSSSTVTTSTERHPHQEE